MTTCDDAPTAAQGGRENMVAFELGARFEALTHMCENLLRELGERGVAVNRQATPVLHALVDDMEAQLHAIEERSGDEVSEPIAAIRARIRLVREGLGEKAY